jgi:hypothetical protein
MSARDHSGPCRILGVLSTPQQTGHEKIAGARDTFERLIAWLARFERRDQHRAGREAS